MRMSKSISRYWLIIGVSALAIAGLFSLVLVLARAPMFNAELFDVLFHKALVVHVDLSVLVWFLSIACLMWSLGIEGAPQAFPFIEEAAQICFALGTLAMTLSPLDSKGVALMSNYIPVITSPIFFFGLALLLCGVTLMMVRLLMVKQVSPQFDEPQRFGLMCAGIIVLIGIMAFFWSYRQVPPVPFKEQYYDMLFWGGGHVLQLLHVQIVMLVWLMLAKSLHPQFYVYKPHLYALFSVGPASALFTPLAYILFKADDLAQRQFFTYMMILAGGIAPTILVLWIMPGLISLRKKFLQGDNRAIYSSLAMSFILFVYGNVLGAMIQGQNVVIPAHYHGAIVGVTLGFMGFAYMMLPRFGWRDVGKWRLAFWQPIVYGGGQFLHISGLAWSGGYGVLRKTPGGLDFVPMSVKAAMGIMGLGGTIAIIGGFMFVIVIAKAVYSRPAA
jgi:hypothetical protein